MTRINDVIYLLNAYIQKFNVGELKSVLTFTGHEYLISLDVAYSGTERKFGGTPSDDGSQAISPNSKVVIAGNVSQARSLAISC